MCWIDGVPEIVLILSWSAAGREHLDCHLGMSEHIGLCLVIDRWLLADIFWWSVDALVVSIFSDASGHPWTTYLRQVQFATHAGRVSERLLVLGHHGILNGSWRLVSRTLAAVVVVVMLRFSRNARLNEQITSCIIFFLLLARSDIYM